MILTDANENKWERRWFVLKRFASYICKGLSFAHCLLFRPYLNVYAHSDENEETAVIGLTGVNIEYNPAMESLLGVRIIDCY